MCLGRWHHQKEKEKGNGKEIVMGMDKYHPVLLLRTLHFRM